MEKSNFQIFKGNFWSLLIGIISAAVLMISCGSDEEKVPIYNPDQTSVLTTFYPDEGKFQEKVILNGENLPTDPEMIRVYFNQRRAPVIGSTGKRLYVMAPRLPGNAPEKPAPGDSKGFCKISVVIDRGPNQDPDSMFYGDYFLYQESITVTTIAGNGSQTDFQEGTLANAILQPKYVCCDNEGNIFMSNWRSDDDRSFCYFCRLNEEENIFTRLSTAQGEVNIPCADPKTGIVSVANEQTVGSFITANPDEYWAPRLREMKFQNGKPHDSQGWKHCMVVNPTDGFLYVRWYHGHIVRINQTTLEAWIIGQTVQGDSYGLTFRPGEPNILYMSFRDNADYLSRSIATVDVSAGKELEEAGDMDGAKAAVNNTITRRSSPSTGGGHRDGPLEVAQFQSMGQIFCDQDGFIYVADRGNHCIRRITPENQVETVLGFPGIAGWKDGTRDEALFREPMGVAINAEGAVYIADGGNSRLRKLSVN